ncbi:MAG: M48 family metallopeptidase [Alphaproteobacteria bacterium]
MAQIPQTFHDAIAQNRVKTFWLVLMFPLGFSALYALVFYILGFIDTQNFEYAYWSMMSSFNLLPFVLGAVAIWVLIAYRWGDKMMLRSAGAQKLDRVKYGKLYKSVDTVAIAAGIKTPHVYVIEDDSLNAFATGRSPENASIAITRGLFAKLNKRELEAVIAHEMSHIIHRDIRLMILMIAGIGFFTFASHILFRAVGRIRGKKSGQIQGILFILALLFLIFGYFIAPLIRLAISRRREYQADAGSVRLTRDPEAMVSALEKISVDARVEILDKKELLSVACIANPLKITKSFFSKLAGLYQTHPPIKDRINAIKGYDK